jgi:hypothetical protein
MIRVRTIGKEGLEPFHTSETIVDHPFHTTVSWNGLRETVKRFWPKCLRQQRFSAYHRWNDQPFERGALAPLSGRFVSLLSLGGTSETVGRSSPPNFYYPGCRHQQRHAVAADACWQLPEQSTSQRRGPGA